MLSTSNRLLRLLSLMQSRRHWTGAELSQRLEVDRRTLRRDVERLRELGYPIDASPGLGGGYRLGSGSAMPPVLLEDDEAVAVAVALRTAAASVGRMEDTALRLLSKLDQWLPARLRKRASALYSVTLSLAGGVATSDVDLLLRIAGACRDGFRLRMQYRDRSQRASERLIDPLRLVHTGSRWYLVAWDLKREDWRTFRVDRVQALHDTGTQFPPREFPGDVADYVAKSITQPFTRFQIRLRLPRSIEEQATRVPPWCGILEAGDAHHCMLELGAESIDALLALMALIGPDFEIIDDRGLLPELRAASDRLGHVLAAA
ncbi:putative DNA-binding transcriptional regulator YafY [Pseudoxanthomonas japonensis]|uniref:helix-turn-helix transcriptional regulator n=1 Tax=Pseudoxanthomonas japonensis TaxID=69284 RepID=UPI001D4EBF00|nr:YafY family protein [Pseudoxanthomonas japonensis]MBA3930861.1 DNA-binding transcriptional regulator [Xanthomonas sp.]MDR7070637.1 putative DNA-binding transcriptional regulator YafY [Pseudoxanthomonas japonensis]